jgi:hypothetical protein
VNNPSNVSAPDISAPENDFLESPFTDPPIGPPVFNFDYGCDLMELTENGDFEFEEADFDLIYNDPNNDSLYELFDNDSDLEDANISLDNVEAIFNRVNSMMDFDTPQTNSPNPSQSPNLPEDNISHPCNNENSLSPPHYVRYNSRCKFDHQWKEFEVSDKSDVARYTRALDNLFRKRKHRISNPRVFHDFDLIPFSCKNNRTLETKQHHAQIWFDLFLPYYAQYFGFDFWELFVMFISSTVGQYKLVTILQELEKNELCISELRGSVIQPFSHLHFIQGRDHIGISTSRMVKLLTFLHALEVPASKILPSPGAYKLHCSYVRLYLKEELKINFDTRLAGSCIVPFESIFSLWIEAILEAGGTLIDNTLPVRNSWNDRPKVR